MKRNYALLISLLIAPFYLMAQQIQGGLNTINAGFKFSNINTKNYQIDENLLAFSYDKCLNKHFQIGTEINMFRGAGYDNPRKGFGSTYTSDYYSVNTRYYINPQNRWVLFTELGFNYMTHYPNYQGSQINGVGFLGGIGVNHFLNNEIALKGVANFGHNPNMNTVQDAPYHYENTLGFSLNVGNFINFNSKNELTTDYVDKGRGMLNADIHVGTGVSSKSQLNYGYFIFKGLMVGLASKIGQRSNGFDSDFSITIHYYHKIHNKLFAHAKAQTTSYSRDYQLYPTYGFSGGIDYFLTPYTLIEANLIDYQHQYDNQGPNLYYFNPNHFTYGPQISLRYFLR